MERVWDFPRPPAVVPCERRARVEIDGEVVADSVRALRVLETSHPPGIYIPSEDLFIAVFANSDDPATPLLSGKKHQAVGRASQFEASALLQAFGLDPEPDAFDLHR